MAKKARKFRLNEAHWGQLVLFQSLIVQLIEARVLTVEQAEKIFDRASKRTGKERATAPDASRYVNHIHDELPWDKLYLWSAAKRRHSRRQ